MQTLPVACDHVVEQYQHKWSRINWEMLQMPFVIQVGKTASSWSHCAGLIVDTILEDGVLSAACFRGDNVELVEKLLLTVVGS